MNKLEQQTLLTRGPNRAQRRALKKLLKKPTNLDSLKIKQVIETVKKRKLKKKVDKTTPVVV